MRFSVLTGEGWRHPVGVTSGWREGRRATQTRVCFSCSSSLYSQTPGLPHRRPPRPPSCLRSHSSPPSHMTWRTGFARLETRELHVQRNLEEPRLLLSTEMSMATFLDGNRARCGCAPPAEVSFHRRLVGKVNVLEFHFDLVRETFFWPDCRCVIHDF